LEFGLKTLECLLICIGVFSGWLPCAVNGHCCEDFNVAACAGSFREWVLPVCLVVSSPSLPPTLNLPPFAQAANNKWHPWSESSPAGKWEATRPGILHARHEASLQAVPRKVAYSKITDQAPQFRGQKSSKTQHRQETANAELALEAENTMPSSFESDRRGHFPSSTGLPSTPQSPVSNINRIRPASPLQTGLVQPWVQSEGSCLASATPLNVSHFCFWLAAVSVCQEFEPQSLPQFLCLHQSNKHKHR